MKTAVNRRTFVRALPGLAVLAALANIYLFAASQGLAAWFHNCNREAAASDFKLRPEQRVLYAQTVEYPA
jgi:hypothetical protein